MSKKICYGLQSPIEMCLACTRRECVYDNGKAAVIRKPPRVTGDYIIRKVGSDRVPRYYRHHGRRAVYFTKEVSKAKKLPLDIAISIVSEFMEKKNNKHNKYFIVRRKDVENIKSKIRDFPHNHLADDCGRDAE